MKLITWLITLLLVAVCGMGLVYGLQRQQYSKDLAQINQLTDRQSVIQDMEQSLEKYRRLSGNFRRMSEREITQTKDSLKTAIAGGTQQLEKLTPKPEEQAWAKRLNEQLGDFMVLSTKLEPMLFLRDIFLKPEAVSAHEGMLKTLAQLKKSAESEQSLIKAQSNDKSVKLTRTLVGLGGFVVCLLALLIISVFLAYVKPIKHLLGRVRDVKSGKLRRDKPSRLKGVYAEIEKAVDDLAQLVDSEQRERQHFVTAVATDLRVPLIPLQTSANLIASLGDQLSPEQKADAAEAVRRSVARLSRTLDDLTDTLQLEAGTIGLSEKIVDIRDVVTSASSMLSGPGSSHEVRVSVPNLPIWALIDRQRLERVLINLISKVMQYSPQGGWIDVSLSKVMKAGGAPSGIELTIHEGTQSSAGNARASGPEQDLLRHWISENGFGLALAKKIVEAHGGVITAAGIAGTSVVFTLRLPEERIANAAQTRAGFKTVLARPAGQASERGIGLGQGS